LAHVPPEEVREEIQNPTDVGAAQVAERAARELALPPPSEEAVRQVELFEAVAPSSVNEQLSEMMGDAPMCDQCGHITVRNGACYKCLNCGTSMGCS
jgi:ribonucleoside-diphosphate reductase alpha chain